MTSPPLGSSKPPMIRNKVVLPQPLGPKREKNSPRLMSSETLSSAVTSPNRLVTPRTDTAVSELFTIVGRDMIRASAAGESSTFDTAPGFHPSVEIGRLLDSVVLDRSIEDSVAGFLLVLGREPRWAETRRRHISGQLGEVL